MKYRRYYQRVLKDRLTALRKVRHAAVCHAGGALENVYRTYCTYIGTGWKELGCLKPVR